MATRNGIRVTVRIEGESLASGSGSSGAVASVADSAALYWQQGTSAGQADKVFQDDLALTVTPTDLDLAGGSNVKDPASQADQTLTVLHGLMVRNTGANDITLGGDSNSVPIFGASGHTITIEPGGVVMWAAGTGADGVTVTAGTGDIVQIASASSTTTARVTLWGR